MEIVKKIFEPWSTHCKSPNRIDSCVLNIPGRHQSGGMMSNLYSTIVRDRTIVVGITPEDYAWYPLPNGANDPQNSLDWVRDAFKSINEVISLISVKFGVPRKRMVLAGFSAGGVMALEMAAYTHEPFAGIIVHAGAILEPNDLPTCQWPDMPIHLFHQEDDDVFKWEERYMPMKQSLIKQGYQTKSIERKTGRHSILWEHHSHIKNILSKCLPEIGNHASHVNSSTPIA